MFELNEKLYFEDEKAKYYTNDFTASLTKFVREDNPSNGNKGINCFVLLAESKIDNVREYVIFNNKGVPVYSNYSYEAVCCQIDILQFSEMMEE